MNSSFISLSNLLKPGINYAYQASGLNVTLDRIKKMSTCQKVCYATLIATAVAAVAVCPQLQAAVYGLLSLMASLTGIATQLVMLGIYLAMLSMPAITSTGKTLLTEAKDLFFSFFKIKPEDQNRVAKNATAVQNPTIKGEFSKEKSTSTSIASLQKRGNPSVTDGEEAIFEETWNSVATLTAPQIYQNQLLEKTWSSIVRESVFSKQQVDSPKARATRIESEREALIQQLDKIKADILRNSARAAL